MNDMLKEKDIEYISVGSHGGRSLASKLIKSSERSLDLARLISKEKPDVGLSKHSVECSRVSFGLKIPTINVIDHETADAAMRLMVPLTDYIIHPEATPEDGLKKLGAKKLVKFYGVCETAHFFDFKPTLDVLKDNGLSKKSKIIIARSEPMLSAHNDHESILFDVLEYIKDNIDGNIQIVFIPREKGETGLSRNIDLIVPDHSIDTLSLYSYSSLMIGAGSCMNREAAIGGCPTVSICPDDLPSVDKFLIEKGIMNHSIEKDKIIDIVTKILKSRTVDHEVNNRKIIQGFENPYDNIMTVLNSIRNNS